MAVDVHHAEARPEKGDRPSLLWIATSALLIKAGFRRRSEPAGYRDEVRVPRRDSHAFAAEKGRGRKATAPSQIHAAGWWDILRRTYDQISKDRLTIVAAGVAFYAILSLFPALAAMVSIYGLFADPTTVDDQLGNLSDVMPPDALSLIGGELTRIAQTGGTALGIGFLVGLALSLWSANAAMKTMFDAMNIVYGEEEKRGFLALNGQSLLFTLGGIVLLLLAMTAVVVIPIVLHMAGLDSGTERIIAVLRWPLLFLVAIFGISVLYRYGPSRTRPQWRWITWGAVVGSVLWLAASLLFSWYVSAFADYNKTYGSLGAMIGLMMWMWLSTLVLLIGAELDAEIEHQTARDTTTGPERPLGKRGAAMADTVGERSR